MSKEWSEKMTGKVLESYRMEILDMSKIDIPVVFGKDDKLDHLYKIGFDPYKPEKLNGGSLGNNIHEEVSIINPIAELPNDKDFLEQCEKLSKYYNTSLIIDSVNDIDVVYDDVSKEVRQEEFKKEQLRLLELNKSQYKSKIK